MAKYLRDGVGHKAAEKLKRGERGFLKHPSFESRSLVGYLMAGRHSKELRKLVADDDVHPDVRGLVFFALRLIEEPRMR